MSGFRFLVPNLQALPPQATVVLVVEREAIGDGLERGLGGTLEVGKVFLVVPDGFDLGLVFGSFLLGLASDALKGIDHLVENLVPFLFGHIDARGAFTMFLEHHESRQDETGNGHVQVVNFLDVNCFSNGFGVVLFFCHCFERF